MACRIADTAARVPDLGCRPAPGPHRELIPLAEQDRTRWNRPAIAEGVRLAATAMSGGVVGEYQLQAATAALHDSAERAEDTDWHRPSACTACWRACPATRWWS